MARAFTPEAGDLSRPIARDNRTLDRHPVQEVLPKGTTERLHIPPPPTAERMDERDEQQVARVETLMIKGFTDIGQLCGLLNVPDRRQMERYIRRVNARWEIGGTKANLAQERGRALRRLREIQQQYWVLLQNMDDKDPRAKIVILNSLLQVNQHEERLLGLTDKEVANLNNRSADNEAVMRMRRQEKLAGVAKRLGELLHTRTEAMAQQGEIMDPTEVDPFGLDAERSAV